MTDVLIDAFIDSVKMLPLLFLVYIGISFIETRYGSLIAEKVKTAGKAGPLLGAGFGIIPQCGFSVISTALYTKRCLTLGTLMAVYLSTSDEAIPVVLAHPDKVKILIPLLTVKALIALISGYTIDFIFQKATQPVVKSEVCAALDDSEKTEEPKACSSDANLDLAGKGCCGHDCCTSEKPGLKEILIHPLIHTLKVFLFIFAVSLAINITIFKIGEDNLQNVFLGKSLLQPFIVALFGLIPNCASSVAITEVFLRGGLSFGSAVAGLSASSGLGLLVLMKENPDIKQTLKIIGLLFAVSATFGTVIHLFYG